MDKTSPKFCIFASKPCLAHEYAKLKPLYTIGHATIPYDFLHGAILNEQKNIHPQLIPRAKPIKLFTLKSLSTQTNIVFFPLYVK